MRVRGRRFGGPATAVVVVCSWVAGGQASAQTPIELGVDAGLELIGNGTDLTYTSWDLPVGAVRVGLHVGEHVSIESSLSAGRLEGDGPNATTVSTVELILSGLYHFGSDRSGRRFHVLLGIPVRRNSFSQGSFSDSSSEFGIVAAGVGLTMPVADHLAVRFQTRGIGWEGSTTRLSFLVGFSYLGGG